MTASSKLGAKGQITIPKEIRDRLGLKPGDTIRYRVTKTGVEIERATAAADDPFATFSEWASDADEKAYSSL